MRWDIAKAITINLLALLAFVFLMPLFMRVMSWWWALVCGQYARKCL